MTTIAYKDGIVAYDSRVTAGGTIWDDACDKHILVEGVHFFFTGASTGEADLFEWFIKRERTTQSHETHALVFSDKLYTAGFDKKGGYYSNPERLGNVTAIGSGAICALTAMDLGCTAKEAVKMAMKRDTATGGRIRTCKIGL
jgi:20S proteasome alpha/beta subunit